jgi:membrane-bound ClpP family serine protease
MVQKVEWTSNQLPRVQCDGLTNEKRTLQTKETAHIWKKYLAKARHLSQTKGANDEWAERTVRALKTNTFLKPQNAILIKEGT